MKIAIGNDHTGIDFKQEIISHLKEKGYEVQDFGTQSTERTDYPLYAEKVCKSLVDGGTELGVLICGTGVGMCITANKFHGIRAVVCTEPYTALMSRKHNDTNVLCLGARVLGIEMAYMILDEWLATDFEGGRHQQRLDIIRGVEDEY
jgi:ribose 5-phosphate isomerase B